MLCIFQRRMKFQFFSCVSVFEVHFVCLLDSCFPDKKRKKQKRTTNHSQKVEGLYFDLNLMCSTSVSFFLIHFIFWEVEKQHHPKDAEEGSTTEKNEEQQHPWKECKVNHHFALTYFVLLKFGFI